MIDASNTKIRDVSVNRNSFEDNFEIEQAGTYTLIISTAESEEIPLVGGIGHVPDSTGVSISIAGFFHNYYWDGRISSNWIYDN